jgi:hypothetical protein
MRMSLTSSIRHSVSRLNGFDYFVLAGAAMNLVVIATLVGFWLVAG